MFTLPDLPFGYNSLEPFIDEETMHFHHDKHHATYIKNLNDALTGHEDLLNMDVNDILKGLSIVPEEIRTKVKNNAGGVANHSLFWTIMCPPDQSAITEGGDLHEAIKKTFGSLDDFKEKFEALALSQFGSGWAWLVVKDGKLEIMNTSNQDSPVTVDCSPILALDVWEHAYYLKYKNMRADYIKAWWNIVNWAEVKKRFRSTI